MSIENRNPQDSEAPAKEPGKEAGLSPWARYWARQRQMPQDSHLVSFGDKVTYTFAVRNDAASLHYDQGRGEIFYKGHKVESSDLESWMVELLRHFQEILAKSEYADEFLESYTELLDNKLQVGPATANPHS